MEQNGLFDYEFRMERLSELRDSLEKLNYIDWEMFRESLQVALNKEQYEVDLCIKFGDCNVGLYGKKLSLPYYMTFMLD